MALDELSRPRPARSFRPVASPDTTSAPVSDSARRIGRGSETVYVTSGLGQVASAGEAKSCSFNVDTVDSFGRVVPKLTGSVRPSGVWASWRESSWDWGIPKWA